MDIRASEDYLVYLSPFIHQISKVYARWELG